MPDLMDFSVTRTRNMALKRVWDIRCQVRDSNDQRQILGDFSNSNRLRFPDIMRTLSEEQQDELLSLISSHIVEMVQARTELQ